MFANRLLLAFTLTGLGQCDSWFDCLPGIIGSIGVSTPRGDLSLTAKSEPVELLCHLNPNHTYYSQQGYNADSLSFKITGRAGSEKLINDQLMNSTRLNSTTIRTSFNPTKVGVFDISCELAIKRKNKLQGSDGSDGSGDAEEEKAVGVCWQKIHVGYPPLPVKNFSCISENWSNLNCTWEEQFNPVRTRYTLHYAEPGSRYQIKECPTESYRETQIRKIPRKLKMCYIDERTDPAYRKPVSKYTFFFNATNRLKPEGTVTIEQVDHYAIVRPGPAEELSLTGEREGSLSLSYSTPREMVSFPPGLNQVVTISNEHQQEVVVVTANWDREEQVYNVTSEGEEAEKMEVAVSWDSESQRFSLVLENLQYDWTNYSLSVRLISARADPGEERLWSRPVSVSARTLPVPPARPPHTAPGSFQAVRETSDVRTVFVYWRQTEPRHHNGPGFNYSVRAVTQPGLSPLLLTPSFAQFPGLPAGSGLNFSVSSYNQEGSASQSSLVFVPSQELVEQTAPSSVTTIYSSDDQSYKVSWFPPASAPVTSYTIFWCETQTSLPSQCSGRLDWEETSVIASEPGSHLVVHSLHQLTESKKEYQLAVAANTAAGSSGLVWSSCTVINNRMITTVRDLALTGRGSSWLALSWSLPCSERGGAVVGYNVSWCGNLTCQGAVVDTTSHNITKLRPWTSYTVRLTVITMGLTGGTTEPVTLQTLPSLPASPPRNLKVLKASNTTANVSWDKPVLSNGPISSYRVLLSLADSEAAVPKLVTTEQPWVFLPSLQPWTRYRLEVRGCNLISHGQEACAEAPLSSAAITFRTREGRPAQPNQPQVSFINSSLAAISWNSDFSLGAAEASAWTLSIAGNNTDDVMVMKVPGTERSVSVDLRKLDVSEDWKCENKTVLNTYRISIKASTTDTLRREYTGPSSKYITVQPPCSVSPPYGLIVGIIIPVVVFIIVLVLTILKTLKWAKRKKEFFEKLGQELEERCVTVTKQESKDDYVRQNQKYQNTNFSSRNNTYFPADRKDLETLLEGRTNHKVPEKTGDLAGEGGSLPREEGSPGCEEREQRPQPQYINSQNPLEESGPPPQSSEYIQLSLANGPVSNGYIQIQQLPRNILPGMTTAPTNMKPELESLSVALVDTGVQSPGYSQVGLIKPEPTAKPGPGGGYIQFPNSSVVISPALLEQSSDPRTLEPRNTVV